LSLICLFVSTLPVILAALQKFSQFLKTEGYPELNVIKILEKVEGHLRDNGSRFMLSDTLSRADCYLLPTLQHIRVAGKVCWSWK